MQRQLSVCWLTVELGPGYWAPPCPTNPGLTQSKHPVQRAHGTGPRGGPQACSGASGGCPDLWFTAGPDLCYLLRPRWAGWGGPGCGHSRDWAGGTVSGETPTQSPLTFQGPGLATGRAELGSDQRPQHSLCARLLSPHLITPQTFTPPEKGTTTTPVLQRGSDSRFLTLASFVGWTCCLESLAQSLSCTWAEALAPLPLGFDAWP